MLKFSFVIYLLLLTQLVSAQDINVQTKIPVEDDSLPNHSSLDLSLTAGNGSFSKQNNARNAGQETLNKILYTAEAAYYHKSGAGITVDASFISEKKLPVYQYAVNPFYYYENKNIYTGVSYTAYIHGAKTQTGENPYNNEYSAEFKWQKPFIRPSVTVDYGEGRSTDEVDSSYFVNTPAPAHVVNYTEKIHTLVKDLSVNFTIDHLFTFKKIFGSDNELTMEPALSLNTGMGNIHTTNSNNQVIKVTGKQHQQKSRGLSSNEQEHFEIQSVSASEDLHYSFGKFFIEPQAYLDYYLPATDTKRLTLVYSFGAGISF